MKNNRELSELFFTILNRMLGLARFKKHWFSMSSSPLALHYFVLLLLEFRAADIMTDCSDINQPYNFLKNNY
ncbi:MAG: hypothetical protein NTX38_11360 [Methylobacter sp.]|nr:hypothetical protein [Methylobacter sp.]